MYTVEAVLRDPTWESAKWFAYDRVSLNKVQLMTDLDYIEFLVLNYVTLQLHYVNGYSNSK